MNNQGFIPVPELKWLFFDLNSYFASVEQQARPELRGKPVAVVPMMTDSTCAIAASYEAKAYGVKTGTGIREAKKMCPDLRCVLARHDLYVEYHHRIFDELENHLHVTKICSVDEAACLLFGDERNPENAIRLAEQIKTGLKENIGPTITCSIGIAPNAFLAKIATDMQKPDGLVLLEPGQYKEKLFALELMDLPGINIAMARRLGLGKVYSVEDFWNLSPKHARQIWGSVEGERFWYRLRGYDVPYKETQKRVVGHSRVLDPALRQHEKAYDVARTLTIKAAMRLRRYQLYARKLYLSVRSVDRARWADERSFAPTQDNFAFINVLNDMWQRMLWDLRSPKLFKVSITLHDLYKSDEITLDLFETESPRARLDMALSESMDKINRRYGASTVSIGTCPKTSAGYVGTKIAFTRIPEKAEFSE